jgi:hypothetical protein
VNVQLHEGRVTDGLELVHLARLDDEDVAGLSLELLTVDLPDSTTFAYELHLIIWVTMRPGALSRKRAEEKDGDVHVSLIGTDELVRAPDEGQLLLSDVMHVG